MSAAEKLRALDRQMEPGPWSCWIPNEAFESHGVLSRPDEWGICSLRSALPQILAVVEAAETEIPALRARVLERAMEQRERDGLGFAMNGSPTLAALTALDQALTSEREIIREGDTP